MAKRTGKCRECGAIVTSGERGLIPWRCGPCKRLAQTRAYWRWAEANPDARLAAHRRTKLKARFGLSEGQLAAMVEAQGDRCALCGTETPGGAGRWHIDHDHACCSGKRTCGECIRGLLCNNCNMGLGQFKDDPDLMRRAAEYVERFRK